MGLMPSQFSKCDQSLTLVHWASTAELEGTVLYADKYMIMAQNASSGSTLPEFKAWLYYLLAI
jgi:hypothetical protein